MPCGTLGQRRPRPVPYLNRPKCFRRTGTGKDVPSCLCGYRAWFERGEEGRRRPDSGAAHLASVVAVTVLCHRSLCVSSAQDKHAARRPAVQNCSPFKLASLPDFGVVLTKRDHSENQYGPFAVFSKGASTGDRSRTWRADPRSVAGQSRRFRDGPAAPASFLIAELRGNTVGTALALSVAIFFRG
jgi:hypothetical protein